MLAPIAVDGTANDFVSIMTSNVPGDYPAEQWAEVTTNAMITVSESASSERRRKVVIFMFKVREVLIKAFQECQAQEQYMLSEFGADRYDADLGIDPIVIRASNQIIELAREILVFGPHNLGDLFYAPNQAMVANVIGTNMATSVTITRRWHAHAREDDPRARAFLKGH